MTLFHFMTRSRIIQAALTAVMCAVAAVALTAPSQAQQQQLPLLQQQQSQSQAQAPAPGQEAPSVQRIAAVVNDEIITVYGLNERMSLVVASTGGVSSQKEYLQLREEVLRSMVDERLQIQEAQEFDITIADKEVEQAINRLAKQNNMGRQEFEKYLQSIGSDIDSLIPQVRASLAWRRLVNGRYGPQVRVSETEVDAVINRMKNNAGEPEYQVSEIYLINDAQDTMRETRETAARLAKQIRGGASFTSLARQFSESTSAAVGGDLGWVQQGQLDPAVAKAVRNLDIGEVSEPIRTAGGFYIVRLEDRRKILGVDPLETQFTLKQIVVSVSGQAAQKEIAAVKQRVGEVTAGLDSCANVPAAAQEIGTQSYGDVGQVRARDLPPDIRKAIMDLNPGQASRPLVQGNNVRVLVVCGKDAPQAEVPSQSEIENRLTNQRLSMMSRRYLRDIRRDAVIEYRLNF